MDKQFVKLLKKSKKGDKKARDKIVSLNLGLIWSIVKKFNNRGYEPEDLFQIGCIGLLKAIDKFDFSYNVKFSTYAVPMIMGEIRRFIRDDNPIKVSRSLKELSAKIRQAKESLTDVLEREPTIKELAKKLKISVEELVIGMEASKRPVSLYATTHEDNGSPLYLIDQIDSNKVKENNWFDTIALKEALSKLEKTDRQIIVLRYFRDMTQARVGELLKMTQVQVSRRERQILKKIKTYMT